MPSESVLLRGGPFDGARADVDWGTRSGLPPKINLVVLPMEPGRKTRHLALIRHLGGGWYEVECMGEGKRCRAGECTHTADMRWSHSQRPIKQAPRTSADRSGGVDSVATTKSGPRRANDRPHGIGN